MLSPLNQHRVQCLNCSRAVPQRPRSFSSYSAPKPPLRLLRWRAHSAEPVRLPAVSSPRFYVVVLIRHVCAHYCFSPTVAFLPPSLPHQVHQELPALTPSHHTPHALRSREDVFSFDVISMRVCRKIRNALGAESYCRRRPTHISGVGGVFGARMTAVAAPMQNVKQRPGRGWRCG